MTAIIYAYAGLCLLVLLVFAIAAYFFEKAVDKQIRKLSQSKYKYLKIESYKRKGIRL
jgi:hypothetical protein